MESFILSKEKEKLLSEMQVRPQRYRILHEITDFPTRYKIVHKETNSSTEIWIRPLDADLSTKLRIRPYEDSIVSHRNGLLHKWGFWYQKFNSKAFRTYSHRLGRYGMPFKVPLKRKWSFIRKCCLPNSVCDIFIGPVAVQKTFNPGCNCTA